MSALAILKEFQRIWAKEEAVRTGKKVRAAGGSYSPTKAPSDHSPEREGEYFQQDQYLTALLSESPGTKRPEVFLQGEARWTSKDGDVTTTKTVGGKRVPRALPSDRQLRPQSDDEHVCSMGNACSVG